ncbi:MAG: c-type cytochrome [Bryobacteraceae bacterium]
MGENRMFIRYFGAGAALLFAASLSAAPASQAASTGKEKTPAAQQTKGPNQKKQASTALAKLLGGPRIDQAAAERGRKIFVPTCGFCHGNDARGKSGPDLVRSALVLHDNKGDTIGPVIHNGRPGRGMPAFPSLSDAQIADISTFLHSRAAAVSNRFAYEIGNIITGDPRKGAAFFNGAGHCNTCHSSTGDLAHVANKYDPSDLQRRMLYPAPNFLDMLLGKAVNPPPPTKVTVRLPSGKQISGTLDHIDEFAVTMHDSSGWYHSFSRDNVTVDVHDPLAAHKALLPKYTDDDMHNVLAYLETLK